MQVSFSGAYCSVLAGEWQVLAQGWRLLARWRELRHVFREARQCGKQGAAWGWGRCGRGIGVGAGESFLCQSPQGDMGLLSGGVRTG